MTAPNQPLKGPAAYPVNITMNPTTRSRSLILRAVLIFIQTPRIALIPKERTLPPIVQAFIRLLRKSFSRNAYAFYSPYTMRTVFP